MEHSKNGVEFCARAIYVHQVRNHLKLGQTIHKLGPEMDLTEPPCQEKKEHEVPSAEAKIKNQALMNASAHRKLLLASSDPMPTGLELA